jgi:hypothetical protein
MTQFGSAMIAMGSFAAAVNLSVETGISDKGKGGTNPHLDASGKWHFWGPFDNDLICDWDGTKEPTWDIRR